MGLVIRNQAHVRLGYCHAAGGSVDLLPSGSQEHLHNTESTPAGSALIFPHFFRCDVGHHLNIWYCWASAFHLFLSILLFFYSLSFSFLFFFILPLSMCACKYIIPTLSVLLFFFFPSLCLFDFAVVSTLLLNTRTSCSYFVSVCMCVHVCLHAWLTKSYLQNLSEDLW